MKSLFITFEGLEGSGKSTQAGLLGSRLKELGADAVITREPGGTRIGELIRDITHGKENVDLTAGAEAYLMAASRAQHVREIIKPALSAGKVVVSDRYLDSSLAYQGYGRQMGEEEVWKLNKLAIEGAMPDLTLLLEIDPETGVARRMGSVKTDRLDLQQKDFYQRVAGGYSRLAQKYNKRYFKVDGNKSIKEVERIIWEKVKSLILNVMPA